MVGISVNLTRTCLAIPVSPNGMKDVFTLPGPLMPKVESIGLF